MSECGVESEKFDFENSAQIESMMRQVVCAMEMAERELKFEHRDLYCPYY